MNLQQAIMTFATDGEPVTPRLVLQYLTETGNFKQIVIEEGSELAEAHGLGQYFALINKFGSNAELVGVLNESKPNETVQFVTEQATEEEKK